MWSIGDIIVWGTLAIGIIPVAKLVWKSFIQPRVSTITPAAPPVIMSNRAERPSSEAVSPRTDASADGRTEPHAPVLKPATLDTCKALRAHTFSRDEARAFLKPLGWSLGNDTWAAAAPPIPVADEDLIVTPYAGRVTNRKWYPEEPELEYQKPEA